MFKRFLGDYPADELEMYEIQVEQAYEDFPYVIISVVRDYEENIMEREYAKAFKRYVDFFEISVQYCSSLILSLVKYKGIEFNETLQAVATKIVEKPLSTGDWINSIFIVLTKEAGMLIPDEPLIERLNTVLFEPKGNILQGWSSRKEEQYKGIAWFRNTYLGHDTSLADDIYAEGLKLIEHRMFKLLEAMAPLADITTFTVDKVVDNENIPGEYTVIPLKSAEIKRAMRIACDTILEPDKYYLLYRKIKNFDHLKESEVIGITPFVIFHPLTDDENAEKTTYLFQTVHNRNLKRMVYVSPNLKAKKKETELFKDLFVSFLQEVLKKISIGKNYKLEIASGKTWDEYQERLESQSKRFLGQMKAEKYDPDLYVDRKDVGDAWDYFYHLPDKRAFALLGNAGSGKTNLICSFTEKILYSGQLVITFNSKIFSQISIEKKLGQVLEEKDASLNGSLAKLNEMARKGNKKVIFFFDAINECLNYNKNMHDNGPVELLRAIDKLLVRDEYDSFKVLITCRTYTWEEAIKSESDTFNLPAYFTSEDIPDQEQKDNISLKGFSEEEFCEAYPKYKRKYNIHTPLETLQEPRFAFTMTRLQDPMVLKMASQIFANSNFPDNIQQFESIKIFKARLEQLQKLKNGPQQLMILEDFTTALRKERTDAFTLQALYAAFENESSSLNALSSQLFQGETFDWRDPALGLLDAGFIRVEKTAIKEELRFTYERFHEFMYARVFTREETDKLGDGMPIPAEIYEAELREMKGYAVINDALRHALVLDYNRTNGDPKTLIDLSNSTVYGAAPLVMNTLTSLISDNYHEVCNIIEQLLEFRKEETASIAREWERTEVLIEKGNKGKKIVSKEDIEILNTEMEQLHKQLRPVIQVRKIAVQIIYEIFKSPVYAKDLYEGNNSPFELLWKAMSDPITKVRDNVSLYIYYISKYDVNIGIRILDHLSDQILETSLLSLMKGSKRKEFQQSFLEPAGRLSLIMAIEALVIHNNYALSDKIKYTWTAILKKLTLNYSLVKMLMPFLKIILRRQATVQADWVNNGIEYLHFWEEIPADGADGDWHRRSFSEIIKFLDPDTPGIEEYYEVIHKGIETGDAFSYFLLERLLVVQGWVDWQRIRPIIMEVLNKPADQPWLDYMQMSMLYVLFQSIEKSKEPNEEAFQILADLTEEWSERCKGVYYAHRNEQANKGLPYKQYPLNWYAAAYCKHFGDGATKPGDQHPLPVFRKLIDKALKKKDKELLYYCIENISILVTDFGYIKSAIQLFDYVISQIRHESQIHDINIQSCDQEKYGTDFRSYMCSTLGTIKSYFPKEVAHFIHHKLTQSDFPDMEHFREDLITYNQSYESIGDLLTHKFGNFIIWGLLNDKDVGQFFKDGFKVGVEVNDYYGWFDGIARLAFNRLFGMKM